MGDTDQPQDQAQQPLELPAQIPAEAFLVVSMQNLELWETTFGCHLQVPVTRRPTVMHTSYESAESEAKRLAYTHGGPFVIFQAVRVANMVDVPTHMTLGGKVAASRREAKVACLHDRPPF